MILTKSPGNSKNMLEKFSIFLIIRCHVSLVDICSEYSAPPRSLISFAISVHAPFGFYAPWFLLPLPVDLFGGCPIGN